MNGIIAVITPEVVPGDEPITVELLKFPLASLSRAIKILSLLKLPVAVNEMDMELPWHKDEATAPVLIVEATVKFATSANKAKRMPVFFIMPKPESTALKMILQIVN